MILIGGGAFAALMSSGSVSAGQESLFVDPGKVLAAHASAPAFLTLKQQTPPNEWTAAAQPGPPTSPAAGDVDLLTQSPDDPAAALPVPTAGAVLQPYGGSVTPRLSAVRGDWTMQVQGLAEPAEAAESFSSQMPALGLDDQGLPDVAAGLDPAAAAAPPRITAQPPAPAVTVRDGRPLVYESGNPSAAEKPFFRLLCDACSGVHFGLNYLDHGQRSLSQYSFTEAVIVNVLQMGEMAATGGGSVNLVELNF